MILFFDDSCGFCHKAVLFFLKRDRKHQLQFAPLTGKTAAHELKEWLKIHETVDSVVLLEDGKISYYSRAVLRLLWELGGMWKILGVLSFLPDWLLYPSDVIYQLVARCRRGLCKLPDRGGLKEKLGNRLLP